MEAGPPLLSWNKYMHDTSSLLVMSAFFFFFSVLTFTSEALAIYTEAVCLCVCVCGIHFFFSSSGGFVLCEYPPGSSFSMVFFSSSSFSSISPVNLCFVGKESNKIFFFYFTLR